MNEAKRESPLDAHAAWLEFCHTAELNVSTYDAFVSGYARGLEDAAKACERASLSWWPHSEGAAAMKSCARAIRASEQP